jgi:hypothetical protein
MKSNLFGCPLHHPPSSTTPHQLMGGEDTTVVHSLSFSYVVHPAEISADVATATSPSGSATSTEPSISDYSSGGSSHTLLGPSPPCVPLNGMILAMATIRVLPNSSITSAPKLFYPKYFRKVYGPSALACNLPGIRCLTSTASPGSKW